MQFVLPQSLHKPHELFLVHFTLPSSSLHYTFTLTTIPIVKEQTSVLLLVCAHFPHWPPSGSHPPAERAATQSCCCGAALLRHCATKYLPHLTLEIATLYTANSHETIQPLDISSYINSLCSAGVSPTLFVIITNIPFFVIWQSHMVSPKNSLDLLLPRMYYEIYST